MFYRTVVIAGVIAGLAGEASAQARTPESGFNGKDATYELSGGSQLRAGDRLLDRLIFTVWERTTVKGTGTCNQGACPITFNGQEVFARRTRLSIISGGSSPPTSGSGGTSAGGDRYPAGWSRLQRGSSGDKVRELQDLLIKEGAKGLTADGRFGRGTEAAIRDLQRRKGLKVDGVAGFETLRALGV